MTKKPSEQEIYEEIRASLKKHMYRRGGRKVFLWGASLAAQLTTKALEEMNVPIEGYIDNDKAKIGNTLNEKEIFAPEKIAFKNEEYFIVIASNFCKSIKNQLFTLGYTEYDMCKTVLSWQGTADFKNFVQLGITTRCNLNCYFCMTRKDGFYDKDVPADMPVQTAKMIIDSVAKAGIERLIYALTGENMINKDYVEILNYAGSRFKHISALSNGQALTEKITDALLSKEHKSEITAFFSLTGYSAETYNEFQGSGSKDKSEKLRDNVYKKVLGFIDERNKKNKSVKVELKYILTDNNLEDFREYLRFWGNKADVITVYPMLSTELKRAPEEFDKIKKSSFKSCARFDSFTIETNTDVHICCAYGSEILGNANETPFDEICRSQAYLKIIDDMFKLNYSELPNACKDCIYTFYNDYLSGVNYQEAKKFDAHLDELETLANGRSVLLFPREEKTNELFYSIYVNKSIEQFNISISDPYEKGYYERFEILAPSIDVFRDKFVVCFDDFALRALDSEIKDAAYKIISYKDIRDDDEEEC